MASVEYNSNITISDTHDKKTRSGAAYVHGLAVHIVCELAGSPQSKLRTITTVSREIVKKYPPTHC